MDDEPRLRPTAPEVLDSLSLEDLRHRIVQLEREIERIRTHIAKREAVRSAADAFFQKR